MGQQQPRALDAIHTRMDEIEALLVETVSPGRKVHDVVRNLVHFRMALNMARTQIDLLDQHVMSSADGPHREALLRLRYTIERATLAQFETFVVSRFERLRNDQAAGADRPRPVARSRR